MNLSYEPVTLPRYQYEALVNRCAWLETLAMRSARLEQESATLEKLTGLSVEQLVQLLMAGYSLCVHSAIPVPRQLAVSIAQLLPHYSLDLLDVAVLGEFANRTQLHGPELKSFLRKTLDIWRKEAER